MNTDDEDLVVCIMCGKELPREHALEPELDGNLYCGHCYAQEYF